MEIDRLFRAIQTLVELVARLRGPGGCPWDAKQTDSSIKIYLLEEAYEVLEAIEKSSPKDVCMELGDLFFQILFLTQLAAERKDFDFVEVVERITEKMINRHPHVFGKVMVGSAEDVALNWSEIKRTEKAVSRDTSSLLASIPLNLPALLRAHRLTERASKAVFEWGSADEIWNRVQEQVDDLNKAVTRDNGGAIAEKIGALLFSLANLARLKGLNSEDLLRLANQEFLEGFEKMERELKSSGIELERATPEQICQAWEKVTDKAG